VCSSDLGPVVDRTVAVTTGRRWTSIESNRVLPATDLEKVTDLAKATEELAGAVPSIPSVIHQMRDAMAGQPQAVAADREGGDQHPWCWDHERTTAECFEAGETCGGQLITGPSDPTGNAGVITDRAEAHHRDILKRMRVISIRAPGLRQSWLAGTRSAIPCTPAWTCT